MNQWRAWLTSHWSFCSIARIEAARTNQTDADSEKPHSYAATRLFSRAGWGASHRLVGEGWRPGSDQPEHLIERRMLRHGFKPGRDADLCVRRELFDRHARPRSPR